METRKTKRAIRLGGPCFKRVSDPEAMVAYHKERSFSAAYDPGFTDQALMNELTAAYKEADIVIAETPAYGLSVLDPDPQVREEKIQSIIRQLQRAESIGALCAVMHGGTVRPGRWGQHSPENFGKEAVDATVKAIRRILDTVRPKKSKLVIETESRVLPDGPDIYLEIIKAVDHPGLGAHLDPVNITLSPRRYYFSGAFIRECFEKIGSYVVSCHAKDTMMMRHSQVRFDETFAGNGELDYKAYITELASLDQDAPIMIEHCNERQMGWAARFIIDQADELGISMRGGTASS